MYKLRWIAGQLVLAFIPTLVFFTVFSGFGFWISLPAFFLSIPISQKLSSRIVSHPMLNYAFGEGVMTFTFDSTGIISPILSKINPGKVVVFAKGRKGDKEIDTIFDRNIMMYVNEQIKAGELVNAVDEEGNEFKALILPENAWEHKFSFLQYPAFLFNKQLGTFMTKDWFGEGEKKLFKKHLFLELIYKIDELNSYVRDFARHVAEQLRPKASFLTNKWLWIIIGIVLLGIVGYFIISSGGGGGTGQVIQNAGQNLVSPR
jgi:hypothetical protein